LAPARSLLVVDFVVAGFAAGAAVVEAIFPEADIELSLAKGTVLVAFAAFFDLLALAATGFGLGRHGDTLALLGRAGNVPLVTWNRLWNSSSDPEFSGTHIKDRR